MKYPTGKIDRYYFTNRTFIELFIHSKNPFPWYTVRGNF